MSVWPVRHTARDIRALCCEDDENVGGPLCTCFLYVTRGLSGSSSYQMWMLLLTVSLGLKFNSRKYPYAFSTRFFSEKRNDCEQD